MSDKVVHVLEDMNMRVDWLKETAPPCDIVWSTCVQDFLDKFEEESRDIRLIILDHDLGLDNDDKDGYTPDRNGQCGADVVRELENVPCPVLVWSINMVAAPEMVSSLKDKNISAVHVPFLLDTHEPVLRKIVHEVLGDS